MNIEELQNLKAAALNATPGKWSFARSGFNSIVQAPVNMVRGGASHVMVCALKSAGWRGELATSQDAVFIAEANPRNILSLLAALEEKDTRIRELESFRNKIYQELGMGVQAPEHAAFVNIENMKCFSEMLAGVEQEYFTNHIPDEEDDGESIQKCWPDRWCMAPELYIEEFGKALEVMRMEAMAGEKLTVNGGE